MISVGVDIDGEKESICESCGEKKTVITPMQHTYSTSWSYDKNNHWHAATCAHTDLKKDESSHDLDENGTCTICGFVPGESNITISINAENIKYDPVIKKNITDIIKLTGTSGTGNGKSYIPEFTFDGTYLTSSIKVSEGEYTVSLIDIGTLKQIQTISAEENNNASIQFSLAEQAGTSADEWYLSAGGIFRKNFISFSSQEPFTVGFPYQKWSGHIYYSEDSTTWTEYVKQSDATPVSFVKIDANKIGDKYYLFFRGQGNETTMNGSTSATSHDPVGGNFTLFGLNGNTTIGCYGNIMTLLEYDNPGTEVSKYGFLGIFNTYKSGPYEYAGGYEGNIMLSAAPELPATTVGEYAYYKAFNNCSSLKKATVLPATIMNEGVYDQMFQQCTSLITATELPATVLATQCYFYMFYNCTSLKLSTSTGIKIITLTTENRLRLSDTFKNTDTDDNFNALFEEANSSQLPVDIYYVEQ